MAAQWQIKTLTPKYQAILRMRICGMTNKQIAEELGMTPQAVGLICRSPLFKAAEQQLEAELRERFTQQQASIPALERIRRLADKAAEVLEQHITKPASPDLQLKAAKDVLDRAGFRAPKEFVVHSVRLDGEFQADVKKALTDLGELNDNAQDSTDQES